MMYAGILLAGSDQKITDTSVQHFSNKLRADDHYWLQSDHAVQLNTQHFPENFETTRNKAHDLGFDLVLVNTNKRRKKLLVADMDSTIIEQECIDELADEAGVGQNVAAITKRAMNGQIAFAEALNERVALLKGLSETILEKVWQTRISLTPGAIELVSTMNANGAKTVLISGGFTAFTARVAKAIGFHQHHANILQVHNGRLMGTVREPALAQQDKKEILQHILSQLELTADDTIAVGDGANDVQMLKTAGLGVAYHAKPIVNEQISTQIRFADLTSLLFLQGYKNSDFIRQNNR